MTPYSLKRGILQKAVSGRLVPRDPCEGEAEDLLAQNYELALHLPSKQRKKIGQKTTIKPNWEAPFDIPAHWKWESFGSLVINYDSERRPITKSERTHGMYPYYGATGIIDWVSNYLFDGEFLMIGEDGGNFFTEKENSFISNGKFWANNHVHVIRPLCCDIRYLKYFLDSCNLVAMGCINGIAVPKLNQENLNSIRVPVPPLQEQKRIVAKIESIMPLVDEYENAWNRLKVLNQRFPNDLELSILQLAFSGKLVQQDSAEGDGQTLLRLAREQRLPMIKSGKPIKAKKFFEVEQEEEIFDIPDSWCWTRIGELFQHNTGKALNSSDRDGKPYSYITTSNVYWNHFEMSHLKEMLFTDEELEKCTVRKGDLLVLEGGDFGRAAIWPYDFEARIQNHIHRLRPYAPLCIEYFYYLFYLYKNTGRIRGKGIGIQGLSANVLNDLVVPLPPFNEQKRIARKIEELMSLIKELKLVQKGD